MMKKMFGLVGATLLLSAMPASAAVVLKVDSSGKLIGATGVVIGKATYDVTFADGTCTAIFGGCTQSKFDFKTAAAAKDAADALLAQVLTGPYITNPGKVLGCSGFVCDTYIPYALYPDDPSYALAIVAANRGTGNRFSGGPVYPYADYSTVADMGVNYARFTLQAVSAVPEPATWGMMLVGVGVIGATARRRRRAVRIAYA